MPLTALPVHEVVETVGHGIQAEVKGHQVMVRGAESLDGEMRVVPDQRTRPGVPNMRKSTFCIFSGPSSSSGTVMMLSSAATLWSSCKSTRTRTTHVASGSMPAQVRRAARAASVQPQQRRADGSSWPCLRTHSACQGCSHGHDVLSRLPEAG